MMMPSHSTPNLQQTGGRNFENNNVELIQETQTASSFYPYLQNQTKSDLNFTSVETSSILRGDYDNGGSSSPPAPPVRDASSLKSIKYGPGHEKFPSWPVAAAIETPQVLRGPQSGGSHRSKSWTDHTNYPKEKVMTYTRPYMKRPNSQQKLKTVLERCEKLQPEAFELKHGSEMDVVYMPQVDREGKALGDLDYMVPSPPERDLNNKNNQQLSQKELEEYARSYQDQQAYHVQQLTQADLEKYTRSYEEALVTPQHQKQPSYAQSEGYHSYVSSTDSMSTPFLDRLRRDSEAAINRTTTSSSEVGNTNNWDESPERERENDLAVKNSREGRDSVVTTSSGSASSSETLKWHGSISDVSVASSSCTHNNSSRQLIAHSARVQTPQRHNSESVLYIGPPSEYKNSDNYENSGGVSWREHEIRNNHQNKLKLFAVNTYTVQPSEQTQNIPMNTSSQPSQLLQQNFQRSNVQSVSQSSLSVADRVSELERHQTRYTYLDPEKRHRVSDPTLKAIQKKALLSFYERHHHSATPTKQNSTSWRSEPQLTQPYPKTQSPPPQPPPRPKARSTSRRASSASDYSKTSWLESVKKRNNEMKEFPPRHQHSNSCGSLSNDLLGPVIMGPSISIDDWVPERPPKNPHLRTAFPDLFQERRVASPDLPPPSPPTVLETEVINNDEPFPPPPPEVETETWSTCDLPNYDQSVMFQNRQRSEQNSYTVVDDRHFSESNTRHVKTDDIRHVKIEDKHLSENRQPTYSPPKCLEAPSLLSGSQLHRNIATRSSDMRISERRHNRPTSVQLTTPERKHILKTPRSVEEHNTTKRFPAFVRSTSYEKDSIVGFATHRQIKFPTERASMRHPSTQKLIINGKISVAVSQKVHNDPAMSGQFRAEPLRSHQVLRSHDTNQRAESSSNLSTLDHESFRPRTQSFIENSSQNSAPLLQPRLSKTYQSMRQISSNHQQQENIPLSKYYPSSVRKSALKKEKNNDELIHGKQSTNNIHLSQSKASSYLSYRGNRERDPQETEYGSYKRIISSGSNKSLECTTTECERVNDHNKWSSNYVNKTAMMSIESSTTESSEPQIVNRNNNNNSLLQRLTQNDKKELQVKQNETNNSLETSSCSHTSCNLPDVLPVSAKISPPHSLSIAKSPSYRSLSSNESTKSHTSPSLSPKSTALSTSLQSSSLGLSISPTSTIGFTPLEKRLSVSSSSSTTPSVNLSQSDFLFPKSPLLSPTLCPEIKFSSSLVLPPEATEEQISSVSVNKHTITEGTSTCLDTNLIEASPLSQVTEGLQLIQRTEVVLRVNACTTDTASQTDLQRDTETSSPTSIIRTPLLTRCKLQEEIDCDQLSRDLANQLSPSDRLKGILAPAPEQKKSTDYVSGLFKLEVTRPRSTTGINRSVETETIIPKLSKEKKPSVQKLLSSTYTDCSSPLSPTSTYFTTSEPKAKFLTQYSRDMAQFSRMQDTKGLNQKKEELMYRLDKKLEVLRSEQLAVNEESRVNETLGNQVSDHVTRVARPQEIAKYRLHVEEVGKITSLLLGLSGRLARAENALMGLPSDHLERKILENKRDKLEDQLEEAKKLKENIDKRSINVSNILHKYLNDEEYGDYDHFINMKAKLIMDAREIADKIKLGEEQLTALRETLNIKD